MINALTPEEHKQAALLLSAWLNVSNRLPEYISEFPDSARALIATAQRLFGADALEAEAKAYGRAAQEARRYASHYPINSDGRNTFEMLAAWLDNNAAKRTGSCALSTAPPPTSDDGMFTGHFYCHKNVPIDMSKGPGNHLHPKGSDGKPDQRRMRTCSGFLRMVWARNRTMVERSGGRV